MAKIKKVGFLMHFNGPRVIGPIKIDTLLVAICSWIVIYTAFTIASVKISITLISAFGISYAVTKIFQKARERASRGYLWHILFMSGIWSVSEDEEKYEELKRLDVKNYIPDYTDKIFIE